MYLLGVVIGPVVVAAGTDLAHAPDFVVVHHDVAAVVMADADVDASARDRLAHPVVLAMVVSDLSTK